ncbi:TRZ/ATZ family hydrolase [Rhodoferax sp. 4810]|uniref:5-methylthioadenosine/S-adenosylhomocysteine deaminase n=1 Tax=Thiospirillum jenense TaxID=1653858 RepID=A0A839H230_9GAMM|nr:TRZ/ATZ family hydrolase [Thiospirillum jenense]MBB1073226.1 TRZ/ATZ family hydrolase [Rhodoferax jenense]MBB1124613.1 TRZ/ATZ family hydrolase [Thiospirillum jenense]
MHVELLIHADWIIPVDADNRTLVNHSLAINDGRIIAVLPRQDAVAQLNAATVVELPGHVLIPGLINAHTHAAMSLLRGLADDLPLMTWLNQHIWPAEQRWVDPSFVADGTQLAIAEMLRGGVTCFNDMYFFPEITAQVAAEAGMRLVAGMIVVDFPTRYAADADCYLQRGLELHEQYRGHSLVTTAFAPHSPYTVSDTALMRVRDLANKLDVPIHIHLHETSDEITQALKTQGKRPLACLDQMGLLNPHLMAVHMTQLDDHEIVRLAATGAHVIHCPESNLKLASGFCPVMKLQRAGVNVALGTDGAASNNDLNMLGELRTAALLAKGVSGDAAALPAPQALRMATINAAQALGISANTGSLEISKAADVVAIDLRDPHTQPLYHPSSQLVYAASSHQVRQVWINGRQVVRDGAVTTLAMDSLLTRVQAWQEKIAAGDEALSIE